MIGQVLAIEPSGERFLKIQFFSNESGLSMGLLRHSKKGSGSTRPDIFDQAEVTWQRSSGAGASFCSDYRLIHRRDKLAHNYRSFEMAARFCRLFLQNGKHWQHPEGPGSRLSKALDLWEEGLPAEVVYLKGLYLLLEDEGLPVREEWWTGLSSPNQQLTKQILSSGWEEIEGNSDLRPSARLLESLEEWAIKHHFQPW